MNIIAIMNHLGAFFKEEPIQNYTLRWKKKVSRLFIQTTVKIC